ncbi:MAG: hypothetical protein A2W91_00730 [Bacteroidetes bacterium GWF2_38_335]|nr:MAG: hypothetical protein A2W91_00730 [Bacteroidetes bacterium GWF2_38_335]OFY78357.1 MAG: hypothetical protein A2281_04110 [Bacteroidetes bacterium RIFOXYA12_FULL_38_20]
MTENNEIEIIAGELIVLSMEGDSVSMAGGFIDGALTITSVLDLPNYNIEISVFPNPTLNNVMVNIPIGHNNLTIRVYNENGQLIMESKNVPVCNNVHFDKYPKGVYFINIEQNSQIISSKKIIKQ